ncbi:MAG: hypothetical protein AAFV85_28045 [Cyanobacteria bacterium J06634_6]
MTVKRYLALSAISTMSVFVAGASQQALAASMTATLTADNHYALFTGNEAGTEWGFIGRNEKGAKGIAQKDFIRNSDGSYNSTFIGDGVTSGDVAQAGTYNWSMTETWTYEVEDGDYLYVTVWDDRSVNEGWIGQFVSDALEDGILLSQAENWEYLKSVTHEDNASWGINPGDNGDTPELADLSYQVATANAGEENVWANALKKADNGGGPWGSFTNKGVSNEADWLFTTTNSQGHAGGNNQNYTIFRTRMAVLPETPEATETPEPTSALGLLVLGLVPLRSKLRRLVA